MNDNVLTIITGEAGQAFQRNETIHTIRIDLIVTDDGLEAIAESEDVAKATGDLIAQGLHGHADKIRTALATGVGEGRQ